MGIVTIFCTVLTAVFVGLKLANLIAWSWLWVLAPIWLPIIVLVIIGVLMLLRDFLDDALGF